MVVRSVAQRRSEGMHQDKPEQNKNKNAVLHAPDLFRIGARRRLGRREEDDDGDG